jgi:hypothetical protein
MISLQKKNNWSNKVNLLIPRNNSIYSTFYVSFNFSFIFEGYGVE